MRVIWENWLTLAQCPIPVSTHLSSVVPMCNWSRAQFGGEGRQGNRIKICKFALAGEALGQRPAEHNTSLFSPKHMGHQAGWQVDRGTGHRAVNRESLGPLT